MKSWIKYGLVGALILVASFWGGSVRAVQMPLGQDTACQRRPKTDPLWLISPIEK